MSLTSLHLMAGGGGDVRGLFEAGFTPVAGANHTKICVETLRANWPAGDWRCADVDDMPMDNLPAHDVQSSSPICTEISQNGGRKRHNGQQSIDPEENARNEEKFRRTRVTAYGIMRCAEVHRPKVVLAENVPDFVNDWHLFDWWLDGWRHLGYRTRVLCLDAAHASGPDNPGSPSWRPRIVVVAARNDVEMPDLELRPLAWCSTCLRDVNAQQVWNRAGARAGDYRKQFRYHCPTSGCHARVEPYTRTAADAFDLSDTGAPIRGREHEYKASTFVRLRAAADYLGTGRARRLARPVPKDVIDGRYHCVIEWKNHADCASIHEPLTTIAAQGNHHGLVTAPEGWRPGMPLDIRDLHLRTITAPEQARAMRFPDDHVMCGTGTQATSLAGNAVPVNVARWLGEKVREVLT
jgi:DNA (cytosine-5)-methyltransferase 1